MAGEIFICYRRADEAWARLLYDRLGVEGVEAWYDALVGPGQDWRIATAEALQASQIFVVLFSASAAESSDIAKELAAATLEKKLIIPVRLENIAPKGAFLYELAARNWVNAYEDTETKLTELAKRLAQMVRTGTHDGSLLRFDHIEKPKRPTRAKGSGAIAVVAVAVILAAAVGGTAYWFRIKPTPAPAAMATRVATLPFDVLSDGEQAHHFADALTEEIVTRLNNGRIQVISRQDAATLRGPDRDSKVAELGVALLFDGTVAQDDGNLTVHIHLDDPFRHVTLWSGVLAGPVRNSEQLQEQVASKAIAVVACSDRALAPVHGLSDPDLLSRYLHACDLFVNGLRSPSEIYDLLGSLREVSAKAPNFTPAHSDLAKFALYFATVLPPNQAAPMRKEGESEARKALALDPSSPDAHLALSWLLPISDWAGREKLLRQGVADDPTWPHTNGFLGKFLAETGRLQEATIYLQKAAAADLQIDWGPVNAWFQCGAGQFEPATSYLFGQLKRKPDVDSFASLRKCLYFAGRWKDLEALDHDDTLRPASSSLNAAVARDAVYLPAEESRKPADIAKAHALALSAPSGPTSATTNAVEALSALGLIDDAFTVAQRYTPGAALTGADTAFLFYPLTAPLRRDPRFMVLADRLGLLSYWRTSGKWPDFCSDPTLPYNCQSEAHKLAGKR